MNREFLMTHTQKQKLKARVGVNSLSEGFLKELG
jgi:hypothetical protein